MIVRRELSRSDTIHGTSPVVQKFAHFWAFPKREQPLIGQAYIVRRKVRKIGLKRIAPPKTRLPHSLCDCF
jgi:hypothetical protein